MTEFGRNKNWLLSGWGINQPDAIGEVGTQSNATQSKPTFSRQELGAGLKDIIARFSDKSSVETKDLKKYGVVNREGVKPDLTYEEYLKAKTDMPLYLATAQTTQDSFLQAENPDGTNNIRSFSDKSNAEAAMMETKLRKIPRYNRWYTQKSDAAYWKKAAREGAQFLIIRDLSTSAASGLHAVTNGKNREK